MSSDVSISASGLSKRFDIYERPHHRLVELLGGRSRAREFWAVRDLDLSVRKGETVGIVGRNGSGKSTLLQMLCGTLEPTDGVLEVRGRVAALLELGAGFNPEFTGLENVYLNGSLMGLSRAELDERLDSIVEFAAIGEFLHQPVKTYSSGMYIRLAFAVAISVEPDILVIDEALAVGDEAFQRKCFARIEALKSTGTTVLFVSHSAGAVVQLCDRAVLMEGGRKLLEGSPKAVVGHYQRLIYAPADQLESIRGQLAGLGVVEDEEPPPSLPKQSEVPQVAPAGSREALDEGMTPQSTITYASRGAAIVDPHLVNAAGERVNVLVSGRSYRYRYGVEFSEDAHQVTFGMMVKTVNGLELFGMGSHAYGDAVALAPAGARIDVEFEMNMDFLPGTYFLNAGCRGVVPEDGETFLHRIVDAVMVRVELAKTDRRFAGFVDMSTGDGCRLALNLGSGVGS